ncbi:type III secretion protein [Pseudomonas luteola]|uniref:type III secretion protein n=1 Tax=Pseudomonas luteola TaxID=47886 RepID=UPI001239F063|nr:MULTISPECIES: type III secretion protein [Pseudomonas]MBA1246290.1 type III secretion protein [Pseudomonas zeshuii]QEU26992.1 type III secretion protein [Pseudomonas luteola]
MKMLALRSVQSEFAAATRALGAGASLHFSAHGVTGELSLEFVSQYESLDSGGWFNTAAGLFYLDDAGAVLNLVGEMPVSTSGELQPWYWQLISQHLSSAVAQGLAPISPLGEYVPEGLLLHCRLSIRHGDEALYTFLSGTPKTFLRWLDTPGWTSHRAALPETLQIPFPLILGQVMLSASQLDSLRIGDVLLPSLCLFNSEGYGRLELADRRWIGHAEHREQQLFLTLIDEDNGAHE